MAAEGIILDGHVHVYDPEAIDSLLDHAWHNLAAQHPLLGHGAAAVLLVAEIGASNLFAALRDRVHQKGEVAAGEKRWSFQAAAQDDCLLAHQGGARELWLMRGRQLVTRERLELLVFGVDQLAGDQPIRAMLAAVVEADGIAIIPWGVGKWLGRRGKVLSGLLEEAGPCAHLLLGDNGGRSALWHYIPQFTKATRKGIKFLNGTDPLPLPGESCRVGSFGSFLPGTLDRQCPVSSLLRLLQDPRITPSPFGMPMPFFSFLSRQLRLRRLRR